MEGKKAELELLHTDLVIVLFNCYSNKWSFNKSHEKGKTNNGMIIIISLVSVIRVCCSVFLRSSSYIVFIKQLKRLLKRKYCLTRIPLLSLSTQPDMHQVSRTPSVVSLNTTARLETSERQLSNITFHKQLACSTSTWTFFHYACDQSLWLYWKKIPGVS